MNDIGTRASGAQSFIDWRPIETCPKNSPFQYLLCHAEKKWIRFGRWFPQQREWYYSATNERNQFAMSVGDAPTPWAPMPSFPPASKGEGGQ